MILVVFLFPIAVYCLTLGMINRRSHPLLISGSWDFAALLFAASGILLLGGPSILTGVTERWRWLWLLGPSFGSQAASEDISQTWLLLGALYFSIVVMGALCVLWMRRKQTAIYNVNSDAFEEVFTAVLEQVNLAWARSGDHFFLRRSASASQEYGEDALPAAHARLHELEPLTANVGPHSGLPAAAANPVLKEASLRDVAIVEVDPAPTLYHVTLRWHAEDNTNIRQEVEVKLRKALNEIYVDYNPVASWLLTIGTALLAFIVLVLLLVCVITLQAFLH